MGRQFILETIRYPLLTVYALCCVIPSHAQQFPEGSFLSWQQNPAVSTRYINSFEFSPFKLNTEIANNNYSLDAVSLWSFFGSMNWSRLKTDEAGKELDRFSSQYKIHKDIQKEGFGMGALHVHGPSLLFSRNKHSFGIETSAHLLFNMRNISSPLGYYLYNGGKPNANSANQPFAAKGFAFGVLSYAEIGLSYGVNIFEDSRFLYRIGVRPKFLIGYHHAFLEDHGSEYTITDDNQLIYRNGNFNYGLSVNTEKLSPTGYGGVVDLGIEITRKKRSRPTVNYPSCPDLSGKRYQAFQTYQWKLGISLMNAGGIQFKQNARIRSVSGLNYLWPRLDSFASNTLNGVDAEIITRLTSAEGTKVETANSYLCQMPSYLSLQYQRLWGSYLETSLLWNQRIVLISPASPVSANFLSLEAGFHYRKFQVALPVSLVEYKYPLLGLRLKIGAFSIGTHTLPELCGWRQAQMASLWFGWEIML